MQTQMATFYEVIAWLSELSKSRWLVVTYVARKKKTIKIIVISNVDIVIVLMMESSDKTPLIGKLNPHWCTLNCLMCSNTYRQFWCLNQNRWEEEERGDGAKVEQGQSRWFFEIERLWFYLCSLKKCSWFLRSWGYSCVVVGDRLFKFPDPQ